MITVGEFLEKIDDPDKLRILQQDTEVYVGYCGLLRFDEARMKAIKDKEVKKFRAVPEIRHKRWRELNLMKPLRPDEAPDYSFSDLQMTFYYTILI